VAHDDDRPRVPSMPQELSDHVLGGNQGMGLSLEAPSENGSVHRSNLWLHRDNPVSTSVLFQQPATTDPIDSPTRPQIGTPLMTTRSFGLALGEIRSKNQHGRAQQP
jgi:hypothetical protein